MNTDKIRRMKIPVLLAVLFSTVAVHAQAIPDVARPIPLSSVRVTGGPLKRAQDLNAEYRFDHRSLL